MYLYKRLSGGGFFKGKMFADISKKSGKVHIKLRLKGR